jgi:hypothetical protein
MSPDTVCAVTRIGNHLFSQMTGQLRYEMFRANEHEYFFKVIDARVTLTTDSRGKATALSRRQNGIEVAGRRIDEAAARAAEEFPQRRMAENLPAPGSEAALRRIIDEHRRGQLDYERLSAQLAQSASKSLSAVQAELVALGDLKSMEFNGVGPRGEDVYAVHFANGDVEWRILLSSDGTIDSLLHAPFKEASRLPLANLDSLRSSNGTERTTIEFLNRTDDELRVYWIDQDGEIKSYGTVTARHGRTIRTSVSHLWLLGKDEQHPVALFSATPGLTIGAIN